MALTYKVNMKYENPWWTVSHDHCSSWLPKEQWIVDRLGKEGKDWICIRGTYDELDHTFIKPLRWGFLDKDMALLFMLRWI
jgi:hypothetical protein